MYTTTLVRINMDTCVFISKSRATEHSCVNSLRDFPYFVTFSPPPPQLLPSPTISDVHTERELILRVNLEVIQFHRGRGRTI
jgi:hypothetical protein